MTNQILVVGAEEPGIGQAVVRSLLERKIRVLATYASSAESLSDQYGHEIEENILILEKVDFANTEDVEEFCRTADFEFSGIVYAEMYFNMEDPSNLDIAKWEKSLRVNLTSPALLINRLQNKLSSESSIVVVTSTEAFSGSFGASAYSASKAGVHNLVKTLANNLGSRSVRVNAVAPGWIGGVMDTDKVFELSRQITPLGRLGSPQEVAGVIDFLLSKASAFVNGTTITVDGGYTGVDSIAKYEFEASISEAKD